MQRNIFSVKMAWLFLLQFLPLVCFAAINSDTQNLIVVTGTAAPHQTFVLPKDAEKSLKENLPSKLQVDPNSIKIQSLILFFYYLCLAMALSGIIPVIVFFIEHNIAGLHAFSNHLSRCKDFFPRIAVIIPAWNEGLVLEHTIRIFLDMDYPHSALRLYIIDDGSIDNTAEVIAEKRKVYPENIFHVRKEDGGKGKSHTVNFGLEHIMTENWAEAILLIDADISFKKDALRRMARHLADPEIGAVTAYIKVGNRQTNYITRSIGYEYIVSQSIARRAQNVIGALACLAGGAQLHSRANIEALGGHIDTSTLAEDTYTTLLSQKLGKKVVYEGNAFVYAEEPKTILDIWKQRFRWARGNLQITKAFRDVWFRRFKYPQLGGVLFGIIWFCVVLTPVFMIISAIGLVGLFIIDREHSAHIFFYLASVSFVVYLYTTIFALLIDMRTSKLSWLEGIVYPGLISLSILAISVNPDFFFSQLNYLFNLNKSNNLDSIVLLFMETWSAFCMVFAYLIFRLEFAGLSTRISNFLLVIVGYGPLLCTVNLAAYIAEIKRPNLRWDKTDKATSVRIIRDFPPQKKNYDFNKALTQDYQREYRFLYLQIISLGIVCILFYLIFFYK